MITIAIDTALEACSLAILRDGQGVFDKFLEISRGHAEVLPVMAAEALEKSGITSRDVTNIVVTVGPGAFAGIRVGLAFAKGFAAGAGASLHGVTSLAAIAATAARRAPKDAAFDQVAVLIDARRGEHYGALFASNLTPLVEPFLAPSADAFERLAANGQAGKTLFAGTVPSEAEIPKAWPQGWEAMPDCRLADPVAIAEMPTIYPKALVSAAPVYIRPPDAKPGTPSPLAALFEA